jgi:hypothetical protein
VKKLVLLAIYSARMQRSYVAASLEGSAMANKLLA